MNGHGGVLSLSSTLNAQAQRPISIEGVVVAGSYNPANNSIQVTMGHTVAAAAFTTPSGQPIFPTVVTAQLDTSGFGRQYGPVGGEQVVLTQCGTQYLATLEQNSLDSPGVPSGETWEMHYAPGTTTTNAFWKLTNDGASMGDGLGGYQVLGGSLVSFTTAGGLEFTLNDTTETITIQASSGLAITIDKSTSAVNIGGSPSAAASITFNGAATSTANGVIRQSDLVTFLTNLQTALGTWASANLSGGSGATGPTLSFTPSGSSHSFST